VVCGDPVENLQKKRFRSFGKEGVNVPFWRFGELKVGFKRLYLEVVDT
jgi:hypothetical protein